jgi:hypothetical protein
VVTVVLVVLALIWIVVLTPTIWRKVSARRSHYSMMAFPRRSLGLRRARPQTLAAAQAGYDGRTASDSQAVRDAGSRGVGDRQPVTSAPITWPGSSSRRRKVLGLLLGGVIVTFLFGFIPPLDFLWDISLLVLAATAGYIALLIHFHRTAAERARKVVYLSSYGSSAATAYGNSYSSGAPFAIGTARLDPDEMAVLRSGTAVRAVGAVSAVSAVGRA